MNRRVTTILLIAFLVAGVCSLMVYKIVGNRLAASRSAVTSNVVAASSNIKVGTVVAASNLTTVKIAGAAPKGSFTDPKDVIGRGVISEIYQGEPVLESRLAVRGSGGGLAAMIPRGMRACAVRVDEVVGVAGFVTPGQRVDVLVSGNPPTAGGASQGVRTSTILQNIQVLSAGTDIQQDASGKPQQVQVVNLLVTPEQAEKLSLASNQLKIQLVLRNPMDTKVSMVPGTGMGTLFGEAPSAAPRRTERGTVAKPATKPYSIVITNGTKTTVAKFSGGQH